MTADRRFVRVDDGTVEWRCLSCAHWSAFSDTNCARCGAQRGQLAAVADPPSVTDAPGDDFWDSAAEPAGSALAVALSIIGPGLGHLQQGQRTAGAARFVIFLVWIIAGSMWTWGTLADVRLAGVVLLVGAGLLWATTLMDTIAVVRLRSEPFGSRWLLRLVIGVTVVLIGVILFVVMALAPL